MRTILKTKRGNVVRIFYRQLTSAEMVEQLADLERREAELSYDDAAARRATLAREDAAGFREQQRLGDRQVRRDDRRDE